MFRPRMLKAQCDQIRVHEFTVSAHVPAKRPLLIRKKKKQLEMFLVLFIVKRMNNVINRILY